MNITGFTSLLTEIRECTHCAASLPLGPRPVVRASPDAKVMLIGQAPGTKVHKSGVPWDDPSGDRLRRWLGLDKARFYDQSKIAIMPMGFCYPGKGRSGDLPPSPACAPLWHQKLWDKLPKIELTLLIGRYAIDYYLKPPKKADLATIIREPDATRPGLYALPHPSPRNIAWFKKNPWFEQKTVPAIGAKVRQLTREMNG